MPDYHSDPKIRAAIQKLRSEMEELEVILEQHDDGSLTDYSSLVVVAEDLTKAATSAMDRADELG